MLVASRQTSVNMEPVTSHKFVLFVHESRPLCHHKIEPYRAIGAHNGIYSLTVAISALSWLQGTDRLLLEPLMAWTKMGEDLNAPDSLQWQSCVGGRQSIGAAGHGSFLFWAAASLSANVYARRRTCHLRLWPLGADFWLFCNLLGALVLAERLKSLPGPGMHPSDR